MSHWVNNCGTIIFDFVYDLLIQRLRSARLWQYEFGVGFHVRLLHMRKVCWMDFFLMEFMCRSHTNTNHKSFRNKMKIMRQAHNIEAVRKWKSRRLFHKIHLGILRRKNGRRNQK